MTDIDELRAIAEAATPGPWEARLDKHNELTIQSSSGPVVESSGSYCDEMDDPCSDEDAALIAATRNALPALIDELERLRKVRDAAQSYVDWRDRRIAQWNAVAAHDHDHGQTPCSEWAELVSEPFDIDQRLDDAIRSALADTDRP